MASVSEARPEPVRCEGCGSELSPRLLTCPACHRLVHAAELQRLASEAAAASERGALAESLEAWRKALELLPPRSQQAQRITATVAELSRKVDASGASASAPAGRRPLPKALAGLGTLGLVLWKFKALLGLALSQGKLLLLGLTQASTLFSLLLSLGVYWAVWGWRFAAGLLACIYVHEMGHVAALRRFGMQANAPMFIPGLGAFVRLKQYPVDAREDARVGLAGPVWGTGAALVCLGAGLAGGWPFLVAMAQVAAWVNLFNLIPLFGLDGARGFRAMSRTQRWVAAGLVLAAWLLTAEGLLVLLLLTMAVPLFSSEAPAEGDTEAAMTYGALVVVLVALAWGASRLVPALTG